MGLHVCQPVYRSLVDSSLLPGVLGGFAIISAVLLLGHLLNFAVPMRLVRFNRSYEELNFRPNSYCIIIFYLR